MRGLFILILLVNLAFFALGRGWLGVPPAETGRKPGQAARQMQPDAIIVLPPSAR
ncbi:hypothetical protein BER2_4489 [plant metagenome]|uniref:Uncharacterized protein n=2 Tax=root TaxID=1 RepID=A0A1C3K627_9BURK|nr:hypothetical protein [Orrella dioscoreae]SBT26979.1 hypothetical protein ODI_01104 [Orrella dioscoreae]SOE52599.1 hypothetical protein ODI_R4327 [Orrella dioscoreae]